MKTTIIVVIVLFSSILKLDAQTNRKFYGSLSTSNAKPELFNDISFGNLDLVSANLKYSKDQSLQKITVAPFKLMTRSSILNDSRLNFTQKNGISTLGVAWGLDNTNPYNKLGHVKKVFNNLTSPLPSKRPQGATESDKDYSNYEKKFEQQMIDYQVEYMKALAKRSFSFLLGYNISLFELVGGDKVKNADSLIANQYATKSNNFSLDINYGFNQDWGVSAGAAYIKKRQSAVEGQQMIDYIGFNLGVSWRAIYLKKEEDLKNDDDYLKSFFIPSIILGCSYEYLKANGDSKYFEDGISYQHVITPYLDFKISPKSQFRLGIPIKKYDSVNKTQIGLGPFLQYSLSLANSD